MASAAQRSAESESASPDAEAADDAPLLPPELLLNVGSYLAPGSRTLLNMMLGCRTLHELLLPHHMSRFCVAWLRGNRVWAHAIVNAFPDGGIWKHVKELDLTTAYPLQMEHVMETLLRECCSRLTSLEIDVYQLEDFWVFSDAYFPCLEKLSMNVILMGTLWFGRTEFLVPKFPRVRKLSLVAGYDSHIFEQLETAFPALEEAHMKVNLLELRDAERFPKSLLAKTVSWHVDAGPDHLESLARQQEFRPRIIRVDCIRTDREDEQCYRPLWRALPNIPSVEELVIEDNNFNPRCFKGARFPPALRRLEIKRLLLTLLPRGTDFGPLRRSLVRDPPIMVEARRMYCRPREGHKAKDARKTLKVVEFWRGLGALDGAEIEGLEELEALAARDNEGVNAE